MAVTFPVFGQGELAEVEKGVSWRYDPTNSSNFFEQLTFNASAEDFDKVISQFEALLATKITEEQRQDVNDLAEFYTAEAGQTNAVAVIDEVKQKEPESAAEVNAARRPHGSLEFGLPGSTSQDPVAAQDPAPPLQEEMRFGRLSTSTSTGSDLTKPPEPSEDAKMTSGTLTLTPSLAHKRRQGPGHHSSRVPGVAGITVASADVATSTSELLQSKEEDFEARMALLRSENETLRLAASQSADQQQQELATWAKKVRGLSYENELIREKLDRYQRRVEELEEMMNRDVVLRCEEMEEVVDACRHALQTKCEDFEAQISWLRSENETLRLVASQSADQQQQELAAWARKVQGLSYENELIRDKLYHSQRKVEELEDMMNRDVVLRGDEMSEIVSAFRSLMQTKCEECENLRAELQRNRQESGVLRRGVEEGSLLAQELWDLRERHEELLRFFRPTT